MLTALQFNNICIASAPLPRVVGRGIVEGQAAAGWDRQAVYSVVCDTRSSRLSCVITSGAVMSYNPT